MVYAVNRIIAWSAVLFVSACAGPLPEVPAYVVMFTPDSIVLDASAQAVVAAAGAVARADPDRSVTVAGHIAPSMVIPGSDVVLSRDRSVAVTNAMVAQGIAQSRIMQQARGSAGGNPGQASRRVEIVLGR